mgnify:CR=1 FL=1
MTQEAAQKEMLRKQKEAEREREELLKKFEDEKNSEVCIVCLPLPLPLVPC